MMAKRLFVVGNLGVWGAEPLGLFEALAEQHDADLHVPEKIQAELFEGVVDLGDRAKRSVARRTAILRVEASLLMAHSVVLDLPLLRATARRDIMEMAANYGATPVFVHPVASIETITDRIIERFDNDTLPVPSDQISFKQILRLTEAELQLAGIPHFDPDGPESNVPDHLCVDGMLSVEEIALAEWSYARHLQ